MSKTANNLGRLPLGTGTVSKAALQNANNEGKRWGIEVVDEVDLDEGVECTLCVFGRVTECLEKDADLTLDFGVADDLAESLQTPVC